MSERYSETSFVTKVEHMQPYGCLLLPQYRGKLNFGGVKAQDLAISPVNINSSLSDLLQELKGVKGRYYCAQREPPKMSF